MNILYHHRTQGTGAEGNHIREVANALRALGHNIDMISPPGVDPYREEVVKGPKAKQPVLKTILKSAARSLPQFCFELAEMGYNFYSAKRLKEAYARVKPDMIYERYAFFCRAPSRFSKAKGISHILEVNEISGIKRQRPQAMVELCGKYELEIFNNVSAIIVVSDFLKNEIVARGISADKVFVMPNAINPHDFNPEVDVSGLRSRLKLDGKIVITFVGIFSHWDKLEFLLDSFAVVRKACPQAHLLIVGDGIQRPLLMDRAKVLGIAQDVTFTGKVARADVPLYIALADLCVLSGSNPFGSPMALFEYMAMGKPVVVPEYGPITAIVDHGQEGFVFNPDQESLFAEYVIELINNRTLRVKMSAAARGKIKGKFTWDNNAHKIMAIFKGVNRVGG